MARKRLDNEIEICKIENSSILYTQGKIDSRFVIIEYNKRYKHEYKKAQFDNITDEVLYDNIIKLDKKYEHQEKKYQLVDDLFDVFEPVLNAEETKINPEFISTIKGIFEKHTWINSEHMNHAGCEYWLENRFSEFWHNGVANFYATLIIARLFGDAKEHMLEKCRKSNKKVPLSARWGKLVTKYCVYKIIDGEYPDFYETKIPYKNIINETYEKASYAWKDFNKDEIMKNINPRDGQRESDMIDHKCANILANWFKKQDFEKYESYAISRIEQSMRERRLL